MPQITLYGCVVLQSVEMCCGETCSFFCFIVRSCDVLIYINTYCITRSHLLVRSHIINVRHIELYFLKKFGQE